MSILNYTTKVPTEKTLTEIHRMLVKAKASSVLTEYDPEGQVAALNFRITTKYGLIAFRLPANVDAIHRLVSKDAKLRPPQRTRQHASQVAWRIVRDWLAVQVALVQAGMADFEQVFLPYAQDETGTTFYEQVRDRKFQGLALMQTSAL